eukprot:scaffold95792_cov48-Phaeocystis_antarctica.AAC.1
MWPDPDRQTGPDRTRPDRKRYLTNAKCTRQSVLQATGTCCVRVTYTCGAARRANAHKKKSLHLRHSYGRDTDTRGVACLCSSCHGQQQSRRLLDETRGCALPPPVQVRPRQVRHQPGLAEEYGTHDEAAPSKLCTRILPNAWRTPLPSLARSQWT